MHALRITPVLYVEEIEPCLGFWVGRLGCTKTIEVPLGDRLGFVALELNGREIMLQTHASARQDLPTLDTDARSTTCSLYVEVDELEPIREASRDLEIVLPERTAFYGMREIGVREPGGHVVVFAKRTGSEG